MLTGVNRILYAVYTRALCYVNLCKHFTIRIENNMIQDLPAGQSIINGTIAQDMEGSVVDPSLLTRSFS